MPYTGDGLLGWADQYILEMFLSADSLATNDSLEVLKLQHLGPILTGIQASIFIQGLVISRVLSPGTWRNYSAPHDSIGEQPPGLDQFPEASIFIPFGIVQFNPYIGWGLWNESYYSHSEDKGNLDFKGIGH